MIVCLLFFLDAEIENPNNMIILPPIPGRSLYSKSLMMRRSISSFQLEELKPSLYGNTYSAFIDILMGSLRFQVLRVEFFLNIPTSLSSEISMLDS